MSTESPLRHFRVLEKIRRKSGIADVLPLEPPKKMKKDIHMFEMPAHAARESMLSSGSGFNNYRGLYNLAIIALLAFGVRLVLENIRKYGLLIRPATAVDVFMTPEALWGFFLILSLNVYILTALFVEKAAARETIGPRVARLLHWTNVIACMAVANSLILVIHPPPLVSFFALFETAIVWMKLISYVAVNQHYREKMQLENANKHSRRGSFSNKTADVRTLRRRQTSAKKEGGVDGAANGNGDAHQHQKQQQQHEHSHRHDHEGGRNGKHSRQGSTGKHKRGGSDGASAAIAKEHGGGGGDGHQHHKQKQEKPRPLVYPENLSTKNIYMYMLFPTLCYEIEFPRTPRVRVRFLIRRIIEVVFLFAVIVTLAQQWVMPTVENTFKDGADPSLYHLIDRTLKLSVPNNIIWLCMFYFYFHSFLNAIGELLRFADRQFYRDWWNATSISYFWKNWNIPVHKWAVRHVYRPLTSQGYTRTQAMVVVFMFSAVMHEVLVSVPLGLFRMWSFLAMLAQVPLAALTDKFLVGTPYGNVVVWSSVFFGQPMAIMLYVQAYLLRQREQQLEAAAAAVGDGL
ncbi:acyl-coenzyme A:diacylglycerol acyltransferase 1 [Salpingoeca rosetta]|uniref:O-acyltransferase n=1 Tax=Salpingoeca rosetta (strain ATCC 50818 / BSB-021) TaxID=946362 RepID=F2U3E2_SALR5|nr:acyl-coenzyme A:diacylglycerol acyltransferase 1 [Salpingoeca rosetta]EGD82136.1 acyl-coenzyme A:diacylglycerol acyltransferase 1 [Salpingoeca rosetta]|eukprot:XP_004996319.1 acyl-coenzyme A:diacylglycerol acyltransferase 1 [Salpingoeca rosetta]